MRNLRNLFSACEGARMMQGFAEWDVEVSPDVVLHGRSGGSGPAVVLLHGHPRAHTTWYRVVPELANRGKTVVCPDLRGLGAVVQADPGRGHERYCDRTMGQDVVALMAELGHERFAVAGHDRGQGAPTARPWTTPTRRTRSSSPRCSATSSWPEPG